ncbi:DNA-binding transcriptional regulator, MerR family [Amphibacillus marinus]|uniref:DNA-binding transcriptional regulator, MerR family n=1 Tax=Amphibacillus marinus TaxID=872970 RepID=A0A1H8H6U0_9BACI|nr:MerR family transcriptional regulator [Amphibacillus marinus]SEN51956.1 DNA-binding transcriptional regulator, MerR family [Amphibacillus marinus]
MNKLLKIGELAKMSGLTIRTLHYYDEVGLLKPTQMTTSGHRQYNMECVTTLYRIAAMKDLGFNLDEIKNLMMTENIDISELIEIQLLKVQAEIAKSQQLYGKLLKLKQRLKLTEKFSINEFKALVPFINYSADKYFTREQFDKLRGNIGGDSPKLEKVLANWLFFITKLNYCYNNKLPNTDSIALECIDYWRNIENEIIGQDENLKESILLFHNDIDNFHLRYGLTDELYKYLNELIK